MYDHQEVSQSEEKIVHSSSKVGIQKGNKNPEFQQELQLKEKSIQRNDTGLPDQLKAGIESLSGHSLDDVKVHYNSSKPAQLNAHAYAQGNQIHLAGGQEKHLAHEAWHVVQQKQGRVRPTVNVNGTAINDNVGLEKEADVMGGKALQMRAIGNKINQKVMGDENDIEPLSINQYPTFTFSEPDSESESDVVQCVSIKTILFAVFIAFALLPTVGVVNDRRGGVARRPLGPLIDGQDMAPYLGMDMSKMITPHKLPNPYSAGIYHESLSFDGEEGERDYLGMGPENDDGKLIHYDDKKEFYANPIIEGLDSRLLKTASDIVKKKYIDENVVYEVNDHNCQKFVKDVLKEYKSLSEGFPDLKVEETPSVKIGSMWLSLSEMSASDDELMKEVRGIIDMDKLLKDSGLTSGSGKERLLYLLGQVESRINNYIPLELIKIIDIKKYKEMIENGDIEFDTVVGKLLEAVYISLQEVINRKIIEKLPFPGWVSRVFIDNAIPQLRDALVSRLSKTIKVVVMEGIE
jgi:hypothetical protein